MDDATLDQLFQKYGNLVPTPDVPPLYHYTDARGFMGIVEGGCLRATDYRFLNDTEECRIGESIALDVAKAALTATTDAHARVLLDTFVRLYPDYCLTKRAGTIYVTSLSERGDLLSQWRGYAAGGTGYSIGFGRVPLDEVPGLSIGLYKCAYDRAPLEDDMHAVLTRLANGFSAEFHRVADDPAGERKLGNLFLRLMLVEIAQHALRAKHSGFREETEWRIVAFPRFDDEVNAVKAVEYRAARIGLVPFVELPMRFQNRLVLTDVIVGPMHHKEHGVAVAAGFLTKMGYRGDDLVKTSTVPFRG
jgi:hypothetical protein